jgi:glucose-6-phosphate 1-epimerase
VRTKLWTIEFIEQRSDGSLTVAMSTSSDESTHHWWPHDFHAQLEVTFADTLKLDFTVVNTGTSPFRFEEALHTYYQVGDIVAARVRGLADADYLDNTDGNREKKQDGEVSVSKATDSAYINSEAPLEVTDPILNRRIHIQKENSLTTVVWNPWKEAAEKMADMGTDEWKKMLCVEGANILSNAIKLNPGESQTTTVTMAAENF